MFSGALEAKQKRSGAVLREFQKIHSCPSTGLKTGPCPGFTKDHVKSLACGGLDDVSNLQWQPTQAAKNKDRWELKECQR